jgi:hypothetical protein
MNPSLIGAETTLCTAYRAEAALYAQALAVCKSATDTAVAPGESWLPRLVELLDAVAALEAGIAAAKADWQRQGRPTGPELKGCLADVAELLRELSAVVNRVIGRMQADRLQMIPQIEQFTRLRRMQRAYERAVHASQPQGTLQ